MTYWLWFRSASLGFVSYRALVLYQSFYQARHGNMIEGTAGLWDVY